MVVFLFKLFLTPILIALATLAARRWGPGVGGWIVALPLTSGPISLFLVLEQGRTFGVSAAIGAVGGVMAVIVYCVTYARVARRLPWWGAVAASLGMYFLLVAVLSFFRFTILEATVLMIAFAAVALLIEGKIPEEPVRLVAPPWWDIPFRMMAATAVVLAVTTFSVHLGPQVSGMFAVFPVFICVMSAFTHKLFGAASVRRLGHGVILGTFSCTAFFVAVVLTLPTQPLFLVYGLAVLVAMAANAVVVLAVSRWKKKS